MTGSEAAAEDLTQETFLKALRHWGQLERAEGARAWLFRIATNTAYDHFRRRRRLPTTQLTELHMETLAAASTELQVEERELLRALVARLPKRYRLPLLLRAYAGYQVDDIAARLGWKVGTVKSRLSRARAQLQKQYAAS
jgi:RNA polymerase sigma-70 factor (ECF subfamily)